MDRLPTIALKRRRGKTVIVSIRASVLLALVVGTTIDVTSVGNGTTVHISVTKGLEEMETKFRMVQVV